MALITGKTVYILGAGASHHTGAPLLSDFLVAARSLRDRKKQLYYKESFSRVFKWIESLRGSSYFVDFDLNNLEHVFSLVEMSRQLGLNGSEELYSDLSYIISETLDTCSLRRKQGINEPDQLYSDFINSIDQWNKNRREYLSQRDTEFSSDSIITFNYDVMLDYAMRSNSIQPEYCLFPAPYIDKFKVLKLHGSTNWATCRKCEKKDPQVVIPSPIAPGTRYHSSNDAVIEFTMVTKTLVETACKYCGANNLEPIIIPPTWSKTVNKALMNVWAEAVNQIRDAFQIIVIGYSMPPTDTFFQYLLTLGLSLEPKLHRIIVVNKDSSEDFRRRYERVFARNLTDRGQLRFITGKTFEEFTHSTPLFESIGCQI